MPDALSARCVLAVDLGGSGLRAALIDSEGRVLARHAVPMPVPTEGVGLSEIDPELWWQACVAAADALAAIAPQAFAQVAAIAISAFTRSQVCLDSAGRVLRPALLWRDTRAAAYLAELHELCPKSHPETRNINAFHPLARLFWLKREEPATFAATSAMLEPKDFLNFRLTGALAGDFVSYARQAAAREAPSLFAAAGLSEAVIPPLQAPVSVMGTVQPGLPAPLARLEGVAVVAMANDTWASVVGLGAMVPGMAYNLSGTTEVFGLVSDIRAEAEGLLTVDWGDGLTQLGGPSQSGGDTLRWLSGIFGVEEGLDMLLATPRAGEPVLFLPYLLGERVPHWDPDLRGAFLGLNRSHGPADLAFAVLEGIAFLNRLVLERAAAATASTASEIRFGGGGASHARWQQIKADITGRPVVVVEGEEQGLAGAAIAAWTALGAFPDLQAAQKALVRAKGVALPDASQAAHYDRLYALFRQAEAALAPLSHGLVAAAKLRHDDICDAGGGKTSSP